MRGIHWWPVNSQHKWPVMRKKFPSDDVIMIMQKLELINSNNIMRKKVSKLNATGLCEGNSPVTGEFSTRRTSKEENASIWWRHQFRAAYRYRFFDIDTNTDTTFRCRYQFDPYRDIHVTILSRVRLFYNEKWRTAIKSTTHNLLQLPVQ